MEKHSKREMIKFMFTLSTFKNIVRILLILHRLFCVSVVIIIEHIKLIIKNDTDTEYKKRTSHNTFKFHEKNSKREMQN